VDLRIKLAQLSSAVVYREETPAGSPGFGRAANFRIADHPEITHEERVFEDYADLCRRLGRLAEARDSYDKALALVRQQPERRFLARQFEELK
jgi:RNA polymerase sigma-70 factor (ECF subfamily)